MAIINNNKPIMKIKFLSEGKVLILDTNTIIRVFNDPRDIVNTRIGDLYISEIIGIRHKSGLNYNYYYKCKCLATDTKGNICNNEVIRSRSFLMENKNNSTLSCGCAQYRYMETDILNRTYNSLTVKEFDHSELSSEPKKRNTGAKDYYYICECPHGRTQIAKRDDLISYHIKGCQCTYVSHKDELPGFYQCYRDMISRCTLDTRKCYNNYKGRGIKVCDRWLNDYLSFKEDMYQSYVVHYMKYGSYNTTIDRINVDGDYEPGNCRWATRKEQNNNKRNTHYYTYNGKQYTIPDMIRLFCDPGIDYEMLRGRLRSCSNYCINDVIINADIFINKQYREQQKDKGLSFPIKYTTDIDKYKDIELPKISTFKAKDEL